jgi:hypothetical protein
MATLEAGRMRWPRGRTASLHSQRGFFESRRTLFLPSALRSIGAVLAPSGTSSAVGLSARAGNKGGAKSDPCCMAWPSRSRRIPPPRSRADAGLALGCHSADTGFDCHARSGSIVSEPDMVPFTGGQLARPLERAVGPRSDACGGKGRRHAIFSLCPSDACRGVDRLHATLADPAQ